MTQCEIRVPVHRTADLMRVAQLISRFAAKGNQVTPKYVLHHLRYAYQVGWRDGAFPELLEQEEVV